MKYEFHKLIERTWRDSNDLPPLVGGTKRLKNVKLVTTSSQPSEQGSIDPSAVGKLSNISETDADNEFRNKFRRDGEVDMNNKNASNVVRCPWRDADKRNIFSNEAYISTLFHVYGHRRDSDPSFYLRQIAVVDFWISSYMNKGLQDKHPKYLECIQATEESLLKDFHASGWVSNENCNPLKGFSIIDYPREQN